jgi:hypothetical protein
MNPFRALRHTKKTRISFSSLVRRGKDAFPIRQEIVSGVFELAADRLILVEGRFGERPAGDSTGLALVQELFNRQMAVVESLLGFFERLVEGRRAFGRDLRPVLAQVGDARTSGSRPRSQAIRMVSRRIPMSSWTSMAMSIRAAPMSRRLPMRSM